MVEEVVPDPVVEVVEVVPDPVVEEEVHHKKSFTGVRKIWPSGRCRTLAFFKTPAGQFFLHRNNGFGQFF